MKILLSPVVGIALMLFASQYAEAGSPTIPGIIFTTTQTDSALFIFGGDKSWSPTSKQIIEVEASLPGFIKSYHSANTDSIYKNLSQYKRQYLGYQKKGELFIYVNAFHEYYAKENSNWKNRFLWWVDGGNSFFQIIYSVRLKRFMRLTINSVA